MDSLRTDRSWFVSEMVRVTTDMWRRGWDERNGGNVSLRLLASDVEPYLPAWTKTRIWPLTQPVTGLDGEYFLLTGTGAHFRNVERAPEETLGVVRVLPGGNAVEILWGFGETGGPTSETPAHLSSHFACQKPQSRLKRVVMHCHATNIIALSYVLELTSANITRALWEASTECLVVFPDGVGVMDWMVPGTDSIGDATAALLADHPMAVWPYHGVFATGHDLGEAFGLIETAEKAGEVLVKVISMGGPRQTISTANLYALAQRFGVKPLASAMDLDGWRMTEKSVTAKPVARLDATLMGAAMR